MSHLPYALLVCSSLTAASFETFESLDAAAINDFATTTQSVDTPSGLRVICTDGLFIVSPFGSQAISTDANLQTLTFQFPMPVYSVSGWFYDTEINGAPTPGSLEVSAGGMFLGLTPATPGPSKWTFTVPISELQVRDVSGFWPTADDVSWNPTAVPEPGALASALVMGLGAFWFLRLR